MIFILFIFTVFIHTEATLEKTKNVYIVDCKWTSDHSAQPQKLMLLCNTSESQNGPVYWKKGLKWAGNGMALNITVRDVPDAGNYTCWSNTTHKLLNFSTVFITKIDPNGGIAEPILQQVEAVYKQTNYFNCEANNYSENFMCFWNTQSQNSELKFNIEAETASNIEAETKSASGTVICESPHNNPEGTNPEQYSASCKRENHCLSTEEYQPIKIVLEVINNFVYEKHQLSFFIRDIIKPDILECEVSKSGLLRWSPPKTWNKPATYFELTYEICVVSENTEMSCEVDHSSLTHHGNHLECIYKRCMKGECFIRSRDRYYIHSAWSNWSKCRMIDIDTNSKTHKSHYPDDFIHEFNIKKEKCACQKLKSC